MGSGTSGSDMIAAMEENINPNEGRRGGGSRRGGRGGGRGGGKGGEMNREVAVSKALSKLLRHAAEEVGLAMDAEGFARVDHVVSLFLSLLLLFLLYVFLCSVLFIAIEL